jgi:hypothetical protein
MSSGYSVGFSEDSDLIALNKFDQFVYESQKLHVANYEVYAYFQELSSKNPWLSVFYVGMTSAPSKRIEAAITREFPKLYAGKTISKMALPKGLRRLSKPRCRHVSVSLFNNTYLFYITA